MRCNGCVISCKREWKMKQETIGVMKVAYDQRLAIKSQKRVDMGPFIRYSCWHCPDPPCARRCPFGAMAKKSTELAVDRSVTPALLLFWREVRTGRRLRSGLCYPRSGSAATCTTTSKAQKCAC
jgi:hypothetical protein